MDVTAQRTASDVACCLKDLVDEHFTAAETTRQSWTTSIHTPWAVLYEMFPAPEARRVAHKLELHSALKHGS